MLRTVEGTEDLFDTHPGRVRFDDDHGRTAAFDFHQRRDEVRLRTAGHIGFLTVDRQRIAVGAGGCGSCGAVGLGKGKGAPFFAGEERGQVAARDGFAGAREDPGAGTEHGQVGKVMARQRVPHDGHGQDVSLAATEGFRLRHGEQAGGF